eukprot:11957296-Alexandrium_andersonii.AAC.1
MSRNFNLLDARGRQGGAIARQHTLACRDGLVWAMYTASPCSSCHWVQCSDIPGPEVPSAAGPNAPTSAGSKARLPL